MTSIIGDNNFFMICVAWLLILQSFGSSRSEGNVHSSDQSLPNI